MRLGSGVWALACLAVCAFIAEGFVLPVAARAWLGIEHQSKTMLEFDGLWRSRGYGWVVAIADRKFKLYHVARGTCVREKKQDLIVPSDIVPGFVPGSEGRVFRARLDSSEYVHTFDKVAQLPAACDDGTGLNAIVVFDAVVDYFDSHYPFFALRGVDWPMLVEDARADINAETSRKKLFKRLGELISHTGDGHVSLEARIGGKRRGVTAPNILLQERGSAVGFGGLTAGLSEFLSGNDARYWRSGIGAQLLVKNRHSRANGKIQYGVLEDNVGYLNITSMEGLKRRKVKKIMRDVVAMFEGVSAVIVDVSSNEGGDDTVSLAMAGYFSSLRTLGYSKHAGDDPSAVPQALYIEPAAKTLSSDIPVFVVTSADTYSAAEVFVLAMRALPNVTHVGEKTAGILSDMLWKPLPNGWSLSLSNEVYLDHRGEHWEARGISPEISLKVKAAGKSSRGDVEAARAVVRTLMARANQN